MPYPTAVAGDPAAPCADPPPSMRWRVLMAVFGAVPATVLGIGAFMGAIAGGQGLKANWVHSARLFAWGGRVGAGVVGLWLAGLDRELLLPMTLTASGLISAMPL